MSAAVASRLPEGAFVIAADSGLQQADVLCVPVDLLVGDLDSVDPGRLDAARAAGTRVEQHPAEKDETDLELALDAAATRGARAVTVVGGHGGRLDHLLANLTVLASPRWAGFKLDAWLGAAHVVVVRDEATLVGEPGSLVTLVALGGSAAGSAPKGCATRWSTRTWRRARAGGSATSWSGPRRGSRCGAGRCSRSGPTRSTRPLPRRRPERAPVRPLRPSRSISTGSAHLRRDSSTGPL